MKVLMLTSSYPIKGSNLGSFVQNIVKGLVKKGVKVGVMIFSASKKYTEYNQDGATIYEYPYTKLFPPLLHKNKGLIPSVKSSLIAKFEIIGYFFKTMKYLRKISKNYDVIHAHWFLPSGFIACILKKSIRKPIITTAWGAEFHLSNNIIVRKILSYVYKKSDVRVAVSKYMKSKAKEYGLDIKGISVIPNSINIKQFSLKREKSDILTIVTVRRLVPEKRIQDLINAIASLPDDLKKGIRLWVVGDGPEKERLINLTKNLSLNSITRFWGMVPYKDIPHILSKADIYVNPSIQEGMATANLEAMAAGVCVIATQGVGNDELISDGINGRLYKPKDVKSLTKVLGELIKNPQNIDKLSKNAAIFVKSRFDSKYICEKYLLEYKRVLKDARTRI